MIPGFFLSFGCLEVPMADSIHGDRLRARVTVTVEVPAGELSVDQIRMAVAESLVPRLAANETRIVSVDDVELVGSGDDAPIVRQPVDQYGRTFWQSASLEQLAAEQGVAAVKDIGELAGDFWPEDEGPDDFIVWLREQRRRG
jgi:hypothetical protein